MTWAIRSMALTAGAAALLSTQAVYAAPVNTKLAVDPLVSLSVFGTAQSRAAVCAAGSAAVAAGAAVAQSVAPGCVLPVTAPPAPPPVTSTYVPPATVSAGPGFNPLFILGGLVLLGGLAWLLLDDDDDDDPVSPF